MASAILFLNAAILFLNVAMQEALVDQQPVSHKEICYHQNLHTAAI